MQLTKVFHLLICLILFNCGKGKDCLEIRDKYVGNRKYYFLFGSGVDSTENPRPTAIVSEEDYNQYQIGDKYCRE